MFSLQKIMPHLIHLWFGAGCEYRLLVHQRSKQAWYSSGALSTVIGIDCLVAWLLLKKQTNRKPVNVDLNVRNLQASIEYRFFVGYHLPGKKSSTKDLFQW